MKIDNSVSYIPKREQTKKRSKSKTMKAGSRSQKQNKNFSQVSKNFLKNVAAIGFVVLKRKIKCYFYLKTY